MYSRSVVIVAATALLVASRSIAIASHLKEDDIGDLNDTRLETLFNQDAYSTDESQEPRCQLMNIQFCENVGYNRTLLPNIFRHQSQQDVINEINVFDPLLRVNCSPDLKVFLCAVYAPTCYEQEPGMRPLSLPPCRSLCESAKQGCSNYIADFNRDWPSSLQCEKFSDRLCVGKDMESIMIPDNINPYDLQSSSTSVSRDLGFICPKNFEVESYLLHLNGKTYKNCAMPCEEVLLNKTNSQIVSLTTFIIALVCVISTLFTCSIFIISKRKFNYPARPIIIIAFCQLMVALCYMLGFFTNNKISCNDPIDPPKNLPNLKMIRSTTMGNKKGICTLQFMTLYFFQMSTMLWWLMMTISWYMIARLKWAPEAVGGVARYFHSFSWGVPALLTIYLSVLGNIEGDSLAGVCYVSTSNQESITTFVMYPITLCLIAGCIFLLSGFKSLWESREVLKRTYGKQTDEHQKLVIRIGLFSLLFITFSCVLLFCHYQEQSNRNSWMLSWLSNICRNREYSIPCPKNPSNRAPHYSIFLLRYLSVMAIGIISALFMLSEKTLNSYREVAELCNY